MTRVVVCMHVFPRIKKEEGKIDKGNVNETIHTKQRPSW